MAISSTNTRPGSPSAKRICSDSAGSAPGPITDKKGETAVDVAALVIVYCTILLPFVTWLLKSNFDAVPLEIEQAARMDGAGLFGVIRHVTLPISKAGLGTAALFAVLLAWDEFFYALLYTNDLRAKTLPVAIADFAAGRATDYALISAAGILTALPPLLIAFFLQKSLISGLAAGGVKG